MSNVIPYPIMPLATKVARGGKHSKYINILSKIASDLSPVKSARLAACIVLHNDIISFGVNEMKSHPFQAKYGKNKDAVFLHAETSAIKNALKYISVAELERCTLYISRVKFDDAGKTKLIFGTAKPCPGCFRCINSFNISKVYYTLDNQSYAML
jgi:deoxycytidylate deaminase